MKHVKMPRKAFQEKTCEFVEKLPNSDWTVYHYNSDAFANSVADSEVVYWPLTTCERSREVIAKDMFESFYPQMLLFDAPDGKTLSCELSFTVESRGEFVETYTMFTETFDGDLITKVVDLDDTPNIDLLPIFEDWFSTSVLPQLVECA